MIVEETRESLLNESFSAIGWEMVPRKRGQQSKSEPVLRVTKTQIRINYALATLLGLEKGDIINLLFNPYRPEELALQKAISDEEKKNGYKLQRPNKDYPMRGGLAVVLTPFSNPTLLQKLKPFINKTGTTTNPTDRIVIFKMV